MAEKKIYTIEINGIKQSTDAVDALLKKLDDLNARFTALENKTVNVTVKENVTTQSNTSSSSSNTTSSNTSNRNNSDVSAQEKAELASQRALEKAYQDRLVALNNLDNGLATFRQRTKELVAEETAAANAAQGYANTMNGLKQELRDLNSIKGNIDLGSDEFTRTAQRVNELNTQLKELEAQQNIHSRNVGNYTQSILAAADGLQSFNANASGVNSQIGTLEDSLRELGASGRQNTEEFKTLADELVRLRRSVQDTDATIAEMVDRSSGLTTVVSGFQSLTAAMQVGAGVAQLFGKNEQELQKQIATVTNLMSIANGLQTLHNQLVTRGTALNKLYALSQSGIEKALKYVTTALRLNTSTTASNAVAQTGSAATNAIASVSFTVLGRSITIAGVALRVFKLALASTGIGLIVVAIGELASWMMSLADSSESAAAGVRATADAMNELISASDRKIGVTDQLERLGTLNPFEAQVERLDEYERRLRNVGGEIGYIYDNIRKQGSITESDSLSSLIQQFIILRRTADVSAKDLEKAGLRIGNALFIESEDLLNFDPLGTSIDEVNHRIDSFIYQLNRIKESGIDLGSITSIDGLEDIYDTLISAQGNYQSAYEKLQVDLTNVTRTAIDNRLAAQQDGIDKELATIQNARKKELDAVSANQFYEAALSEQQQEQLNQARLAINAKYDKQIQDARKNHIKQLQQIENSIINNRIAIMNDGLEKTLAGLEQQRRVEINAARETGLMVGEQTKAINDRYDKEILEAKRVFYQNRERQLTQFAQQVQQINEQIARQDAELATTSVNNRYDNQIETLSFDVNETSMKESINKQRTYYSDVVKLKQNAIDILEQIQIEQSELLTEGQLETETRRFNERTIALQDALRNGLVTQQEFDEQLQVETDQHNRQLAVIQARGTQEIEQIQIESNNSRRENNNQLLTDMTNAYQNYVNQISYLESNATVQSNQTGIIDYNKTRANLNNVRTEYKNVLDGIGQQYIALQQAFENNEITFNQFREAKSELNSLEQSVNDSLKTVNNTLDTLITNTIQSITQYVGQYVGVIGGLWSTFNEMAMNQLEQEQARLEEEAEMLDAAYQKQEEITQKHTDKLKSIDDELRNSRGSRRQHLIDQLNAERKAQEQSLIEEQRIQKEKDANERKQEALEKQRREQEKKNAIVQATINTFTAVSNALAVQPWFVGLALSAVALGLGLANVAQIRKQQYADGGLLRGKSHAQGGIPVGNTGVEVEGNEYIVKRKSTERNLPLLDYINRSERRLDEEDIYNFFRSNKPTKPVINKSLKNKFADGGQLPVMNDLNIRDLINYSPEVDERPIVVSVVEIEDVMEDVRQVRALANVD